MLGKIAVWGVFVASSLWAALGGFLVTSCISARGLAQVNSPLAEATANVNAQAEIDASLVDLEAGVSVGDDASLVEKLDAVLTMYTALQTEIAAVRTGNIHVGGGGDSVTAWIYAAIAAAAIFYPALVRPLRLWWAALATAKAD